MVYIQVKVSFKDSFIKRMQRVCLQSTNAITQNSPLRDHAFAVIPRCEYRAAFLFDFSVPLSIKKVAFTKPLLYAIVGSNSRHQLMKARKCNYKLLTEGRGVKRLSPPQTTGEFFYKTSIAFLVLQYSQNACACDCTLKTVL